MNFKKHQWRLNPARRAQNSGSALLIILGCVALLTVLVLSFFVTSRTELSSSNFYSKGVNTQLLSENVINLVEGQLREGARSSDLVTSQVVAWASQPGMIRTYDTTGNPHMFYKLYSSDTMNVAPAAFTPGTTDMPDMSATGWASQPNVYTDLNDPITTSGGGTEYPIIDPTALGSVEGFSYTAQNGANGTSNLLPMPVKWLYVLKSGALVTATPTTGAAVSVAGAAATNPIIGRVAFWTDDETSKVNLNTASEGTFWDSPIGNNLQEHGLLGNLSAAQNAAGGSNTPGQVGYAEGLPAALEFQAIPGHPATTSLSSVFGYGPSPNLPDTSLNDASLQWPLYPAATGSYATYFGPYFSLTPRYQSGGSMGASQATPTTTFTPPSYRLYDSVDELAFDPSRTAITSAGPASLYPAANGALPVGRESLGGGRSGFTSLTPQVVNQKRFFLTAHSRAPEETLFGTPRVSLWPLQTQTAARTAKDNLLAFCSTIGGNPYYFQRSTYFQLQSTAGGPITTTTDGNGIASSSSQDAYQDFSGTAGTVGAPTPLGTASSPQTGVARNQDLYGYLQAMTGGNGAAAPPIPGFGGSFWNKYPGGPNGNGAQTSDRDEILTEMFDFLRSSVNTFDVTASIYPRYSYSPFYANYGSYPVAYFGGGSTVPIQIAAQGGTTANTYGIGRNYGIAEVSLVFMTAGIALNNGIAPNPVPAVAAGGLDPSTNFPSNTPITPPYVQSPTLFPPTLRRMAIGGNLPWACEEDYWLAENATNPRALLYFDPANQTYGSYYITIVSHAPKAYAYPYSASPTLISNTAIGVPIFCYWDTTTQLYGSYFAAPTGAPNAGSLFICSSPALAPVPFPAPVTDNKHPTALPSTAVTIGDPQTTQIQAFVLVRPFSPMVGNPAYSPNVRIRVTGLDALGVNFSADSTSASLGFNSGSNAVMPVNGFNNALSSSDGGMFESVIYHTTADRITGANNGNSPASNDNSVSVPWQNDGTKPSTLITNVTGGTPNYNYPFIGKVIPLQTTSYPSPFGGEDACPFPPSNPNNSIQLSPTPAIPPPAPLQIHNSFQPNTTFYNGNTMTLNGGTLQIDVLDGTNPVMPGTGSDPSLATTSRAHFLESIKLIIPTNSATLPIPTVEMANGIPYCGNEGEALGNPYNNQAGPRIPGYNAAGGSGNYGTPNSNAPYQTPNSASNIAKGIANPSYSYPVSGPLNYYWQLPYDPRNIVLRFASGMDRVINRGDVVRSFVINPLSKVAGDMRMLAANPIQTSATLPSESANYFYPIGGLATSSYSANSTLGPWSNCFIKQLHTQLTDSGNFRWGYNLIVTSQALLGGSPATPIGSSNFAAQTFGMGITSGALIPGETYPQGSAPVVTPELAGAYMDPTAKTIPGDWTLGQADNPDGGFVNKVDEGMTETGYGSPYYSTNMGNTGFQGYDISYSPNRQVPSAIVFGTLPTRVMQGVPWCTLLFCPNPAANDSPGAVHPGFGTDSLGVSGPTSYPPYTTPPDHLFLDLFWMPVVEPYAISEPFSTAGKVNLNYEIAPFQNYIHRSTALHAVMKSTRILAISTNFNTTAGVKSVSFHTDNPGPPGGYYSIRYGINLAATIDDFATTGNPTLYTKSAFYQRFITHQDLFRSASEICNIFLVPQRIPGATYNTTDVAVPTDASATSMEAWWKNFQLTGDNGRESPYNQIYPRLTTKSNTFQVHMRVQVLAQAPVDRANGTFNPAAGDAVSSEYRGSAIVERYLDPNQTSPTTLPDFATSFMASPATPSLTATVDNYVRYRVVSTHAFSP